jgi:APA family basic amino acid/polyamine antiporter
MLPRAGGQYVYLREAYSPLAGFLYGWTLFLVIQTGTIAAVAIGFAKFLGVIVPGVSPTAWIIPPIDLSEGYAISLSVQQLLAIALIVLLTWTNTRGLHLGKIVQNAFTSVKALSLAALILVGLIVGWNSDVVRANFAHPWTSSGAAPIHPDFAFLPTVSAAVSVFGLFIAFCVAQVGTLFSADAWFNITFTAGEVRNPRRTIPLALAIGTALVIGLYVLCNLAYLVVLPMDSIRAAPDGRVATAVLQAILGDKGAVLMALAIIVSTFGCNNGLILAGARVYHAMAQDGLFFAATGRLNRRHVPAVGLIIQCAWACLLVLPRTRFRDAAGLPQYGNLYSNLLDYVVSSVLIFYILTIGAVFVLRRTQPDTPRPYRAFGYPLVPALYMLGAATILGVLLAYKTQTTWPGLVIVLSGIPVYFAWRRLRPE